MARIIAGETPPDQKAGYVTYMKQQLKELLDTCDPEVIWFDGEWVKWWTEEDGQDMYAYLRGLKPSLIINNRVGKGRQGMQGFSRTDREYAGDFGTPEQEIPETGVDGVDWESCMTMNDTWGYKRDDDNWKSSETLVRNLIDTASKGGNFLLNVGPMASGAFPEASVTRLAAIGAWMEKNSAAIYGATASPVGAPAWGRYTARSVNGQPTLYAHVFERPAGGRIDAPFEGDQAEATLLATGEPLAAERTVSGGLSVTLPSETLADAGPALVIRVTSR